MRPYKSIESNERAIYSDAILQERLCDTLLPKLISGQLRVPDAERFVEGVV